MSKTLVYITLSVPAVLVALVWVAKLRYSGTAPVKLPAESCDRSLWKHVYQPERLRVIEACTSVEGRVVSVRQARDGDLHIGLDPDHKSVLNFVNVLHGDGTLIVEVVCEHPPVDDDPKSACSGFVSQVTPPKTGDRIRVTGAYVTDSEYGWNEIHPVTRIDLLR
ncbi:MAG TPA: hypothetical protein VKL40_05285 [Candidatus Angelobacter sp.]|nr:hypothetical protein [Candidatus Angelobacter sp.]